jgi:hypothetical protein
MQFYAVQKCHFNAFNDKSINDSRKTSDYSS